MTKKPKSARKRARENELRAQGRAAMRDPEHVARHVHHALHATRSIARFSLRNQMLLSSQAEEKGITLTDVDTYRGWARRGRKPARTGDSLLVVVPKTYHRRRPTDRQDDPDTTEEDDENPRSFYMGHRWDISQTVELDDQDRAQDSGAGDCKGCDAHAGEPCEPGCACFACAGENAAQQTSAEVLWNTLQKDITHAGYRFDWPAAPDTLHGERVHVDHAAEAVRVHLLAATDPDSLAALAVAAAEVISRPRARTPRRELTAAIGA